MTEDQHVHHSGLDSGGRAVALRAEQDYVDRLYARLDELRARTSRGLSDALARGGGGGYAAQTEREARADENAVRLARLNAVENGLCFGRIDLGGGAPRAAETRYIGRVGLRDEDHEPILIDWRAPAARPFYAAAPSSPDGLVRRRHLHVRDRAVVGLDDEVFDLDGLTEDDRRSLVGEAALLAALSRGRTGRMGDIVATIQAEQDRVIRAALPGALVVQGGPGTGKTVAALHRAAYLLYTHRQVLERRGVLVVGPNPTFLRYIGRVLPSLGETDVVVQTVGRLYPGVAATAEDGAGAAAVKGALCMAAVLEAAVADRQRVPDGDLVVRADGIDLRVPRATCERLRDRAREPGLPHNRARRLFVDEMLWELARAQDAWLEESLREAEELLDAAGDTGRSELEDSNAPLRTDEDTAYARETLWADPAVRAAVDGLWPLLTPERLVGELLSDPGTLAPAAAGAAGLAEGPGPAEEEWRALLRPADSPWTTGDVPLLDEAAELLGTDGSEERARERAERHKRKEAERYAQGVLEYTGLYQEGMLDAAGLAERQERGPAGTTAERAAADRTWAYGHVIVDEAQELSEMAWRTVMRRVPAKSLTVVGDLAQTGSAAGARSWQDMLGRYVGGRLHVEHLLVNYRTPAEIMAVAADVLAEIAPDQRVPESVRDGGALPRAVRVDGAGAAAADGSDGLAERLPGLVAAELAEIGEGRLAVITPADRHADVAALLPEAAADAGPDALDHPVAVLTPAGSKGLEFDSVVVVDPSGILAASASGGRDLYVAVTRATRRLTVVHEDGLPGMLSRLQAQDGRDPGPEAGADAAAAAPGAGRRDRDRDRDRHSQARG
ncbi:HelD family protein [Streptomonospora wellingtoniae]|uniref:ATP-binding domain-containing protein n=1 Tax=Streptomonospora wellingtoniae TaxID=3075544 RepID=A0ABU2KU87_9ACTN|nr:ATP-binding domain-containing protein [Streptomonospora sp. DSM 45055]MDT0302756.1 ATP-binding domain-containing protein [Streptomonospora sp. DSM 45055]